MDDMNAFERQLAARLERKAGPPRPVDAMAIAHSAMEAEQVGVGTVGPQRIHGTDQTDRRYTMFSALKFVAAAAIVALFGGFLLAGVLSTPQEVEVLPADATESPSPTMTSEPSFPTGTFVADKDDTTLTLRPDGTCDRAGVPCTFGVTGKLFSEMAFEDPSGPQKPATYYWTFDDDQLTFEPWGPDQRPDRGAVYADHVFRPVGEIVPLPAIETDFPTGYFVTEDASEYSYRFDDQGGYRSLVAGRYAVNGDLFTEMTHSSNSAEKVPATYHWDWDGERLTFSPWGEDTNVARRTVHSKAYVRGANVLGDVRRLLLSDPRLDYWVTVEVQEQGGRYAASATIDDGPPGPGAGDTIQQAVEAALEALDVPYASEMAEDVPG